jgi:FAD/FMN-containing dehydrogenase
VCFGHLGDGNLHFNVAPPAGVSNEDFLRNQDRSTAWCTTAWWPSAARFRRNTASAR